MIFNYPPKYPKSVHLYLTNECNLDCEKCYYRSKNDPKQELSFESIKKLFQEWKNYGLASIAIGGGEPLIHPRIVEIVKLGRDMGYFMAVTTNGTILKPIEANRVHISYDELHSTWKNEDFLQNAIDFYKKQKCIVGINHIVSNLKNIEYIQKTFENFDNFLLIREKPVSQFKDWDKIQYLNYFWIEGCIEGSHCEQGILSFHLDYELKASICSNFKEKIPYTTLIETWNKLKLFNCEIRDSKAPKIF
ncbi:MAG: radical SAM protein [Candidatus Lokiarchaeota archaeon]|nr:radical SAM protein [Candidatus Lokiarchaeota archaeon]